MTTKRKQALPISYFIINQVPHSLMHEALAAPLGLLTEGHVLPPPHTWGWTPCTGRGVCPWSKRFSPRGDHWDDAKCSTRFRWWSVIVCLKTTEPRKKKQTYHRHVFFARVQGNTESIEAFNRVIRNKVVCVESQMIRSEADCCKSWSWGYREQWTFAMQPRWAKLKK